MGGDGEVGERRVGRGRGGRWLVHGMELGRWMWMGRGEVDRK